MTKRFRMIAGPNGSGNASDMRYLAEWSDESGFAVKAESLPMWFLKYVFNPLKKEETV